MQYRPLGQSGIQASVVGFGACPIGGWLWGDVDEAAAIETTHAVLDAGINLIDTAPAYGMGVSETLLGKALRDRRDKAVLITKCGLVWHTSEGTFRFKQDGVDIRHHLRPESIRYEIQQSLTRLQTDYIDLYITHWPDVTTPVEDTMAQLMKLRDQGLIRAIGASNVNRDDMDRYRATGQLDATQEKYSMLDRTLDTEHLPYCHKHNIAVLAYSPMEKGLLTGKMSPDRAFPEGDSRRGDPLYGVEPRRKIQRMFDALTPLAEKHNVNFAQLSVAWAIHQPGLTHALVGARSPEQAYANAAAGDVNFTPDDLVAMDAALETYAADVQGWRPPAHPLRRGQPAS